MQKLELSLAVALIQQLAEREFETVVDPLEIENALRGLLLEPRNLLRAMQFGLVTREETAKAVAGHIHTWLMDRTGRSWQQLNASDWSKVISALEDALL